ncbi:MAG: TolC family protein, partial [Candidatus Zixiibacteriota bacterium]
WYSLRMAADDTAAVAASLKRARVILNDITNRFAAGVADSVDVLQAQLAVTNAELNLRNKQTSLATRRIALAVLLGLPVDEPIIPVDSLPEPTLPVHPESVRADKPELRSLGAAISQQRWRLRQQRADFFPTVSVYTGYSYGKPNLDRFNQTWSDYFTVGANLQWSFNLGGKTSHEISSRDYRLRALEYQRDDLQDRLAREARIAYEQLKLALERYRTAKKQVNIAEANYRLAVAQYDAGSITTNRLLEIEAALTSAQSSLAAGLATYYLAESNWLYAIGAPELRGE